MSLASVSDDGRFAVLALDHRDSLRQFLSPHDLDAVTGAELTLLKRDLAEGVGRLATGVMLEPEYSIPQVSARLEPGVGFFAALEAQGYLADPGAAPTTILDGWSVAQAQDSGAAVAKMLLPYHPDHPLAAAQRSVAAETVAEARRLGMSIVLEPLFHGLKDPADRLRVVAETASDFAAIGPDLLKLPFPVDPDLVVGRSERVAACRSITDRSPMPWAMLSGGGTFRDFADQLAAAVDGGCAGFMVGRALWGEAASAPAAEREEVIRTLVRARMAALRGIVGLDPTGGRTRH